jgi:hypothetical protein
MPPKSAPDTSPPDKRLQFLSHAGRLYITYTRTSWCDVEYTLRQMDTHNHVATSRNLFDLRETGEAWIAANPA